MFPTLYIPSGEVLLYTYEIDLDAIANAGSGVAAAKAAGVHVTGAEFGGLTAADRFVVTANLSGPYVAWSVWAAGQWYIGGNSGSSGRFHVVNGVDDSISTHGPSGSNYNGFAAARAAFMETEPYVFSGSEEYWFFLADTPIGDNTGGMSLTARVYGRR